MKKLLSILAMIAIAVTAQAQSQLKTVRGKTKDGKSVVVRYYPGSYEDAIESVSYQVVDDLQSNVKNLQNQIKTEQGKLNEANNEVKRLRKELEKRADQATIDSLNTVIEEKTRTINAANNQIDILNSRIRQLEDTNVSLRTSIDSVQRILDSIRKTKNRLQTNPGQPKSIIGVEAGLGQVIYGNTVNTGWSHEPSFSKHIALYYGTPQLAKSFPISLEAGVGARLFGMSASKVAYQITLDEQEDADHHSYQAQYQYSDLNEQLSLTYLDIPIRLCLGQPIKGKTSVYAKIGITPSLLLNSSFTGKGTYTLKGYYEQMQVTFEDIPELGFVTNADCYPENSQPDMKRFVLWGNVSVGTYVPFGDSPLQLQAGLKLDYPFMELGNAAEVKALPEGMGIFGKNGKIVIPSFNLGLIYNLK
jgi:prefoldin subunit 5